MDNILQCVRTAAGLNPEKNGVEYEYHFVGGFPHGSRTSEIKGRVRMGYELGKHYDMTMVEIDPETHEIIAAV